MKKYFLILSVLLGLLTLPSYAQVTIEQTTDAEYLINSGYSQIMAEDIFMLKNRSAGNSIEPLYETSGNKFVKGWRKFFSYLDPAQDANDRIHHDIKMAPSYTDL